MSVTFTIESVPTGTYSFPCYNTWPPVQHGPFPSREAGDAAIAAHREDCEECRHEQPFLSADRDVSDEINLANGNAARVLALLGLGTEVLCGSMPAGDFLVRTRSALASPLRDAGVPATGHRAVRSDGQPGPLVIDAGRPAGYFTGRLDELASIASKAAELQRRVIWG